MEKLPDFYEHDQEKSWVVICLQIFLSTWLT